MSIRGRFVWEELMTTDVSSAAGFYGKVAGIKTKAGKVDPNYTEIVGASGKEMGGLMPLPDEAKAGGTLPCWISYVGVDNADETAKAIAALGGKVHKGPFDIPQGGRIAIASDPQGAVFAIYSNPAATEPQPAGLGNASWHELSTSDFAAAFSFYQNLFGWRVITDMDMGGQGIYRLFGAAGSSDSDMLGGMYTKPPNQPGPPAWLPYMKVANVVSATDAAKKLGATILHGPADVPGGKITMAVDPQGVAFAIHQVIPPASLKPATKGTKKKTKAAKKKAAPKKKSAPKKKKSAAKKKKAAPKKRKAGSKK